MEAVVSIVRKKRNSAIIAGTVDALMGEDGKLVVSTPNLSKDGKDGRELKRVIVDLEFPNDEFIPLTLSPELSLMLRSKQIVLGDLLPLNVSVVKSREGEEMYSVALPRDESARHAFDKATLQKNASKTGIARPAYTVNHTDFVAW